MNLAERIYADLINKVYTDLSKASEEDLTKLAQAAVRAENVFGSVTLGEL